MQTQKPTLHILCGKIAAGKSTLASRLAAEPGTVLLVEDDWLHALFAQELQSLQDYVRCTARLRAVMGPHVVSLLTAGASVVLDFAANTRGQRDWFRGLVADSGAAHSLHFLDVPDDECLTRLRARNAAGQHPFTLTDAQFHQFTSHFAPPAADEGFNVVRHTPTRACLPMVL